MPSQVLPASVERVQRTPTMTPTPSQAQSAPLPLAKLRTGSSAQTVQREEDPPQVTNPPDPRANGASQEARLPIATVVTEPVEDQAEELMNSEDREDLDEVAKAILPLVKRLLTLERERRSFR
jgi:hypothetical protein